MRYKGTVVVLQSTRSLAGGNFQVSFDFHRASVATPGGNRTCLERAGWHLVAKTSVSLPWRTAQILLLYLQKLSFANSF